MSTDLEARRRAIAEALRAIMAEPIPQRQHPALRVAAAEPAPMPARSDDLDDLDELDKLAELDDWSVPPLETVGSMSRTASLALFGHA